MRNLDEATIERIIEQITRQVLILVQEEQEKTEAGADGTGVPPISAHNYVERVQPVVNAGADRIASTLGIMPTDGSLAHMIDHTVLKPDASQDQIAQLCHEARKYSFASVCVNPANVKLCAQLLKGSGVPVCTVVGFPLGATPTEVKVFEAQQAVREGASEVDMVINVGALKSKDYEVVERDIASIARASHAGNAILKVIIEAALLTDEEKVVACQDLHRLWAGRRYAGGRRLDAARGWPHDGRQGGRGHPYLRRCAKDDRGGCQPDWRQCQR